MCGIHSLVLDPCNLILICGYSFWSIRLNADLNVCYKFQILIIVNPFRKLHCSLNAKTLGFYLGRIITTVLYIPGYCRIHISWCCLNYNHWRKFQGFCILLCSVFQSGDICRSLNLCKRCASLNYLKSCLKSCFCVFWSHLYGFLISIYIKSCLRSYCKTYRISRLQSQCWSICLTYLKVLSCRLHQGLGNISIIGNSNLLRLYLPISFFCRCKIQFGRSCAQAVIYSLNRQTGSNFNFLSGGFICNHKAFLIASCCQPCSGTKNQSCTLSCSDLLISKNCIKELRISIFTCRLRESSFLCAMIGQGHRFFCRSFPISLNHSPKIHNIGIWRNITAALRLLWRNIQFHLYRNCIFTVVDICKR